MSSSFAENLSKLRKANNISQRQAASDLKISQALLSHYENGIREPRLDFVVKVSDYFGVSADYILGRTSIKKNPFISMNNGDGRKNDEIAGFEKQIRTVGAAQSAVLSAVAAIGQKDLFEAAALWLGCGIFEMADVLKSAVENKRREDRDLIEITAAAKKRQMENKLAKMARTGELERFSPSFEEFIGQNYPAVTEKIQAMFNSISGEMKKIDEVIGEK